jgi:putative membrane protein
MKNAAMRSKTLSHVCTTTALAALWLGSFAFAQEPGVTDKVPSSERRAAERKAATTQPGRETLTAQQFALKAAIGGQKEVQLSQIALQQSQNPEVKTFAQHMVQDHSALSRQLTEVAQRKSIQLPSTNAFETALIQTRRTPTGRSETSDKLSTRSEIPETELEPARKLEKLSGSEFDRAYVKEMVKDHEKTIAKFEEAAQSLNDPELKQFAEESLPKLREHNRMARQLSQTVGNKEQ